MPSCESRLTLTLAILLWLWMNPMIVVWTWSQFCDRHCREETCQEQEIWISGENVSESE
jgi:hypothetical protein